MKRTDALGWQNGKRAIFMIWLRLGDLTVPLMRTEFIDIYSIRVLADRFDIVRVRKTRDGVDFVFSNREASR